MKFSTISEVEQALSPLVAAASLTTGRNITTERTFELAAMVGNPQDHLKVVHVAGTSGKTSTSYYIARLIRQSGATVGLTVSPHITSITERVQINGAPLDDSTFCAYMSEFLPQVVTNEEDVPSYYEVMMVFALWVFAREHVDYAVIETGLGGLHDSSNICRRQDKLCVITDIGIDHTHVLGDTIREIAQQKAGIIAPNNIVMMYDQGEIVMDVVGSQVAQQNGTLHTIPDQPFDNYQDRNFALACGVYECLAERDELGLLSDDQRVVARETPIPGRMQLVQRGNTAILLDGAHNEQKMCTLVRTLATKYPSKRWHVVIGMKQSKDYVAAIAALAPLCMSAVAVPLHKSQDMKNESVSPSLLIAEFEKHGVDCHEAASVNDALDETVARGLPDVLVTGSLYVVAEVQ